MEHTTASCCCQISTSLVLSTTKERILSLQLYTSILRGRELLCYRKIRTLIYCVRIQWKPKLEVRVIHVVFSQEEDVVYISLKEFSAQGILWLAATKQTKSHILLNKPWTSLSNCRHSMVATNCCSILCIKRTFIHYIWRFYHYRQEGLIPELWKRFTDLKLPF